ncbi:MAG: hypothetical protein V3V05_08750 [Pontiella sp.]
MKWMAVLLCLSGIQPAMADSAFVDFDLGWIYPQKLGAMTFDRVEKYDTEALGYSIFYKKDGFYSAEVSVFNLGREAIADGYKAADVSMLFDSVETAHKKEEKEGQISSVRKRGAPEIPNKGDIRFANTIFQYLEPRVAEGNTKSIPRINSVYVTAAHNNFFKVQFRFDMANGKAATAMSKQLITQLIQTIKSVNTEEEVLIAACDALINNPSDYAGRIASRKIWAKAQAMGELNIYTHLFVWPEGYNKPKNADLLTMGYFAGMLKVVIPQGLESGGEPEGFAAMLQAYSNMRTREDIEVIPQLDEWAKHPDKKALFEELLFAPAEE